MKYTNQGEKRRSKTCLTKGSSGSPDKRIIGGKNGKGKPSKESKQKEV